MGRHVALTKCTYCAELFPYQTNRLTNLAAEGEAGAEKTARLSELSYREEASTPSGIEKRSRKQKGASSENSLIEKSTMGPYFSIGKGTMPATATAKSARAHAKSYSSGPPLVPGIIVASILQYVQKVKLKRTRDYIEKVCRYWSLKREARRGAPLLKRLYLEVSSRKSILGWRSRIDRILPLGAALDGVKSVKGADGCREGEKARST